LEKIAREVRSREIDYPLSNPQTYVYFRKDELGGYLYVCFDSTANNLNYYVSQDIADNPDIDCPALGEPINASDVKVKGARRENPMDITFWTPYPKDRMIVLYCA